MVRLFRTFVPVAFLLACPVGAAWSDAAYPAGPIRLIVNFPAGGTGDLIARAVQPYIERQLGQPIIVENRAGAGGVIGTDAVAKAAPDGYLVGFGGTGSLAINVALQEKMPYDPLKDLVPITMLADIPFVFAASPSFGPNSVRDVIALAKATPDRLSIGHGGNGSAMHLTAQLFNQTAGVDLTLVSYKGSAPLANDILAGHSPLGVMDMSSVSLIKAGLIKPLAVSSERRVSALPDVPTFAEAGLPGIVSSAWLGIVAPVGTPAAIVAKLNAATTNALKDPDVQERIRKVGAEPMPSSPDEFAQFIKSEIAKWTRVAVATRAKRQ
jgi:tripartite-type tricarboxylate transporter receptor subunit TctC